MELEPANAVSGFPESAAVFTWAMEIEADGDAAEM
jgi:hypothetical protein